MTRDIDALVADTVAARPLPDAFEQLDDRTQRYVEAQAAKARVTPEAYYTLARSRAKLTREQRHRADLVAGQVSGTDPDDADAIVASIRR